MITNKQIEEWNKLRHAGMASAVGEYTPDEFWALLDEVVKLRTDGKQMADLIRLQRQHGGGLPTQDVDEFLAAFPEAQ